MQACPTCACRVSPVSPCQGLFNGEHVHPQGPVLGCIKGTTSKSLCCGFWDLLKEAEALFRAHPVSSRLLLLQGTRSTRR